MQNTNSLKSSNLEESKEEKAETSNETEITDDAAKHSKLNESNAHVVRGLQYSNSYTGKYELFNHSVVFYAIISFYVTY